MQLEERTLEEKVVYDGTLINVSRLQVALPSGHVAVREVVHHPGAVAILAEATAGSILLVEQYRKAVATTLLELPAGKLEPGETPEQCAIRELGEETGYVPARVVPICSFFTSPGFADELIYLFWAQDLIGGEPHLDDDEFVHVRQLDETHVRECMSRGELRDAKTWVALLWWLQQRHEGRLA